MTYDELEDLEILGHIQREMVPDHALADHLSWRRICEVRAHCSMEIDADTWEELCRRRGRLSLGRSGIPEAAEPVPDCTEQECQAAIALASRLFRLHRSQPSVASYASEDVQREHPLAEIDAAYEQLERCGLVARHGFTSTSKGSPRPAWRVTEKGLDAVLRKSPDL